MSVVNVDSAVPEKVVQEIKKGQYISEVKQVEL